MSEAKARPVLALATAMPTPLGMQFRGLEPWYGTTLATHVLSRET